MSFDDNQRGEPYDLMTNLLMTAQCVRELERDYDSTKRQLEDANRQLAANGIQSEDSYSFQSANLISAQPPSSAINKVESITDYLQKKVKEEKTFLVGGVAFIVKPGESVAGEQEEETDHGNGPEETVSENRDLRRRVAELEDDVRQLRIQDAINDTSESGYGSSKTVKSQNKGQSLLMSEAASIKADVCPSCEELKDKLKLSKDMVQRLEEWYSDTCRKNSETESVLEQSLGTVQNLDEQLEEATFEKYKFKQELDTLSRSLSETKDTLHNTRSHLKRSQSDKMSQGVAARIQVDFDTQELKKKDAQLKHKDNIIQENSVIIKDLQDQISQLNTAIAKQKEEAKRWRRISDEHQAKAMGLTEQQQVLKDNVKDNEAWKIQCELFQKDFEDKVVECHQLHEKVAQLEEEVRQLRAIA